MINKVKEMYKKLKNKVITSTNKHPLIKPTITIFLILFLAAQASTLMVSIVQGDPYIFPMNLIAKYNLENDPDFQSHIESRGYIIKWLPWVTAVRHGDIWEFYIKVQNKPGWKDNDIHYLDDYWYYHTNGEVYYNARTGEVVFDLIGEW